MQFQEMGTTLGAINFPALIQPKHDGMRAYYIQPQGETGYFFTKGQLTLNYNSSLPPGRYDGELIIPPLSRAKANGLFNSAFKKTGILPINAKFIIFDYHTLEPHTYLETLTILKSFNLENSPFELIETHQIISLQDIPEWVEKAKAQNLEGWVIKDPFLQWSPSRTKYACKIKVKKEMVMRAIDLLPGLGKHTHRLGAVMAQGILANSHITANVGTGFSDEERKVIWDAQITGFLMEVEYQEATVDSLISPIFKRLLPKRRLK